MASQPISHQTISFLAKRFAEAGIQVKSRHGQNFLIDLNLLRLLADSAELTDEDVVLEVGTGTGALTGLLGSGPPRSLPSKSIRKCINWQARSYLASQM